jgi:hypothetical protein
MAKFSMKQDGKALKTSVSPGKKPNQSSAETVNMSVGNISKADGKRAVKTDGIKVRGTGAATKGLYARGPMA